VEARPRFYLGGASECAAELARCAQAVAALEADAESGACTAEVEAERWLNLVIRYRVARQSLQSNRAPLADRLEAAEASAAVSLRARHPAEFGVCVKLLTRTLLPETDPGFRTARAVEWAGYEVLLAACHTRSALELQECLAYFLRRREGLPGEREDPLGVLAFEMKVLVAVSLGNAPAFRALLEEAEGGGGGTVPPLRAAIMRLAAPFLFSRGYGAAMRAHHTLPLPALARLHLPLPVGDVEEAVESACAELGVDPPHRVARGQVLFKEPKKA